MKLPQAFIDDVLARIDLVEIISKRISLKQTGRKNYSGLCPFHQEKTPSFSVNQNKQFYYCFGCKASGNAIGFLMAYEKLSFLEAIEVLATKVGLKLPLNKETQSITNASEPLFRLFEKATLYFEEQLQKHRQAQQYLQKRGLTPEIIEQFQIGFAPAGWRNLKDALGSSAKSCSQLVEIGLLTEHKNENHYDRFRNRIMFPIKNKRGQIIGFGGRCIENKTPKYLNSPETPYFHKNQELYGLYESLQANKELSKLIIVEGYLDVIALHQHGIKKAVATLGTAVSLSHLQTLLRHSDTLFFCFDGDEAGKSAAGRALEIALPLMNTGHKLNFLILPDKEDPDSYIRQFGPQEFIQKLKNSLSLPDFFFQKLQRKCEINSLAGKTRFVHLANKYLQKIPKGIFQELMYEQLASIIGMHSSKVNEILQPKEHNHRVPQTRKERIAEESEIPLAIRLAICLLIQKPKIALEIEIPAHLQTIKLDGMDLLLKVLMILRQNPHLTTGSLLEYFITDNEKQLFEELAMQDLLLPDEAWINEFQGALKRVCEIAAEQQITDLMTKASREGLSETEKIYLQKLLIARNV